MESITSSCGEELGVAGRQSAKYTPQSRNARDPSNVPPPDNSRLRLDRPGLDSMRDAVRDAAVDAVAVFSPDGIARKYAYHVPLLEEFRRASCDVIFLHRPISDDPNDQLLLQIRRAIAEYERAVLTERF